MDINPNRPHHKDSRATEKHEIDDEKSDSESSEHGEVFFLHMQSGCVALPINQKRISQLMLWP